METLDSGSSYYKSGDIQPLHLIESQHLSFHAGNVVKYVTRAYAPGMSLEWRLEQLAKAEWYIHRMQTLTERQLRAFENKSVDVPF